MSGSMWLILTFALSMCWVAAFCLMLCEFVEKEE